MILCKVKITTYKRSGKWYATEIAEIEFRTKYPMLEDDLEDKIMANTGAGHKPFVTYEWVGGDEGVFLHGLIAPKG